MPNAPTIGGVFLPSWLNACNSPSSTGAQGYPDLTYPTGAAPGKVFELNDSEAFALQAPAPSTGQCFGGAYQWVHVDSGATAANVRTGLGAFIKLDLPGTGAGVEPESGYSNYLVTSGDQADAASLCAGVFLNSITPGNWGCIFVGAGRVNVTYGAVSGAPAIGNTVNATVAGTFTEAGATVSNVTVGLAATIPAVGGTSAMYIRDILYRI